MIHFKKHFFSYEGEGPYIGLKTLFLTYKDNLGDSFSNDLLTNVKNIYINTDFIDLELFKFLLRNEQRTITCEMPIDSFVMTNLELFHSLTHIMFFLLLKEDKEYSNPELDLNINLKIEVRSKDELSEKIKLANKYANLKYDVYLMPLYTKNIGEDMMDVFDSVHPLVRIMPPTQFLINIK